MNCLLEKTADGSKWKCTRTACGYETAVKPTHTKSPRRGRCGENPVEKRSQRCQHLGQPTGFVECPTCNGNVRLKVFACEIFQQATMKKPMAGMACCANCREYVPLKDFADSDGSAAG